MQLGASHTPSSHLLLSANQAGDVDSSFQMRQLSPERGGDLSQVAQCPDHPRVLPDSEACGPSAQDPGGVWGLMRHVEVSLGSHTVGNPRGMFRWRVPRGRGRRAVISRGILKHGETRSRGEGSHGLLGTMHTFPWEPFEPAEPH